MPPRLHPASRIAAILAVTLAIGATAWQSIRSPVFGRDGIRYVAQARSIAAGDWSILAKGIDHPGHPLAIAVAHLLRNAGDSPESWQRSARWASLAAAFWLWPSFWAFAAVSFGHRAATLSCLLAALAAPLAPKLVGDGLSESWLLALALTGFAAIAQFLKAGSLPWLVVGLTAAGGAYLVRPEGMLIPLALALTLMTSLLIRSGRRNLPYSQLRVALVVLVALPMLICGPLIILKGGIGTKMSIGRLVGTTAPASPWAIERHRPLDPDEPAWKIWGLAAKDMFQSFREVTPGPLVALAALAGVGILRGGSRRGLDHLFGAIALALSALALIRLNAVAGYCEPRHTVLPALLTLAASGRGLEMLARGFAARLTRSNRRTDVVALVVVCLILMGLTLRAWPETCRRFHEDLLGYRQAGEWLAERVAPGETTLDLTGIALFFGGLPGDDAATFQQGLENPHARWLVARPSHVEGPWPYCAAIRQRLEGRRPVASFPLGSVSARDSDTNPPPQSRRRRHRRVEPSRVDVYDLMTPPSTAEPGRGSAMAERPDLFRLVK